MQRGSGANSKPHSNSGGGDRAEADAATDSTANRGKPTKDQRTFNESRSNTARTPDSAAVTDDAAAQRASKINTSKSNLRTGNAPAEAAGKPAPAEAAPGSTSSIFK